MIHVAAISKKYKSVQALGPTTVEITEGSFTAVLGPSGSGKTTLLRIIAGLETSDSGSVSIGGHTVSDAASRLFVPPERRGLGMVFQDFALWPHMTVFENVAYTLRARRDTANLKARVTEAIETVRLGGKEGRYPGQLSGGEQQRVAFARAVVGKPRVILLDEPLSALDALLREQMRLELKTLVSSLGLTALYVTHDQLEALSMADRVLVMNNGTVLQSGSPEQVYSRPTHPFVASFLGRSNWFADGNRMIRPEHLSWHRPESAHVAVEGTVAAVGYLGDRYEILVRIDGDTIGARTQEWTAYRATPVQRGAAVTLYISEHNINSIITEEEISA
ncbi:MAG: ABC transporter ATP-binding protein [Spirochaetaceae bacterium]|nr:MAG: ABC transporter ATP-binding protein [Spirochaetaceae bacterium]